MTIENSDELSVEQWQFAVYAKSLPAPQTYTIVPQFSDQGWRILRVSVYAGDGTVTLTGDTINSAEGGDPIVVQPNACFSYEPRGYTGLASGFAIDVAGSTPPLFVVEYLFKTVPGNTKPAIVKVP